MVPPPQQFDKGQVGYATSDDGISWERDTLNNPVLTTGSPGEWDGNYAEAGTVMLIGDTLHMWYDGSRAPTGTYLWRIGHATSVYTGIPDGIDDHILSEIPTGFELSQNYPNPFNPYTVISWQLAVGSHVELVVYNLLGEKVVTLVSERMNAGKHIYQFDGKNLASGVYYYQLVAGDYREVKKMILLR
jgi:hypothetical protein